MPTSRAEHPPGVGGRGPLTTSSRAQNLEVFDFELSAAEMDALAAVKR